MTGAVHFGQSPFQREFTEAGSVEVRVPNSQLVLSVKDNGIGIAEAGYRTYF